MGSPTTSNSRRFVTPGRGLRGRCLLAGLAGLFVVMALPAADGPEVLTSVGRVRELTMAEAEHGLPVRLQAVVTANDQDGRRIFVAEGASGLEVEVPTPPSRLTAGARVEIVGRTARGRGLSKVLADEVLERGRGEFPTARSVSFASVESGSQEAQWIEIAGVVRWLYEMSDGYMLDLTADGRRLMATVPSDAQPRLEEWIDAEVRVRGVATATANARGEQRGVIVRVSDPGQVTVMKPPARDPFSVPFRAVRDVRRYDPRSGVNGRVGVRGVVTYLQAEGAYAFLQDGDDSIYLQLSRAGGISAGDRVEAVGFPDASGNVPYLDQVICRPLGRGPEPEPLPITAAAATRGEWDTRLLRVAGRLLQVRSSGAWRELVVDGGDALFSAFLTLPGEALPWAEGSVLELTGVWSVVRESSESRKHYRLFLRRPEDVRLVQGPVWWTFRHTAVTAGAIVLTGAAGWGWMLAYRRRIREQSLLREKHAAEIANAAKSQFLANISHEIRTPVNGVTGMLQLLQRTALDPRQQRYARQARSSAEALLTVIGDVLDFSRIEAGKMALEQQAFAVPDVLDLAVRLLAPNAEAKGLELVCRVDDALPRQLVGDANRLRQVLLNLVGNAVKFTERGRVEVRCGVVEAGARTVTLRVDVQDTGCGIPRDKLDTIFQAFSQADGSASRAHGGAGLGLTISRELVRMMNGNLGVESEPGEGSRFWFTVRLARPEGPPETAEPPSARRFDGLRVLVVDDCAVVRTLICDYVRAWRGIPDEAAEGGEGLDKLRRAVADGEPYAVAVLDWKMPGVDGFTLARLIKRDERLKDTGLVLLSGFSEAGFGAEAEAAGIVAAIPKPARKSDLFNAIVSASERRVLPRPGTPAGLRSSGQDSGSVSLGAPVVVVAEDNEINQDVAADLLAALGCVCIRAANGLEAVALVQGGDVDLVLMDCQMPLLDGYEATRRIRHWEHLTPPERRRRPRLPVVALTAHAMSGDREGCLSAGMDDYLTKPLEPDELQPVLERWLRRRLEREPKPPGSGLRPTPGSAGPDVSP